MFPAGKMQIHFALIIIPNATIATNKDTAIGIVTEPPNLTKNASADV